MRKITDRTGQDWIVEINYGVAKRCQAYGIDLFDEEQITGITSNVMKAINLLYITVEDQAKERGVSDIEFGNALSGTGDAPGDVIVGALYDFFMDIGRNPPLAELIQRAWDLAGRKMATATSMTVDLVSGERMDSAMDQALERARQKAEAGIDLLASGEKE